MDFEMGTEPGGIEWRISEIPVEYEAAVDEMERRVAAIRAGTAPELVWLLEHPPLYTAGTSAREEDLLEPQYLPVHHTGRGGRYTYHGPGQRIAYVMLDLARRGRDVRCHVHRLEESTTRCTRPSGRSSRQRAAAKFPAVSLRAGRRSQKPSMILAKRTLDLMLSAIVAARLRERAGRRTVTAGRCTKLGYDRR